MCMLVRGMWSIALRTDAAADESINIVIYQNYVGRIQHLQYEK